MLQGVVERAVNCVLKLPIPRKQRVTEICRKFTVPLRAALRDAGCWRTIKRRSVRLCMYLYCTRLLLYRLLIYNNNSPFIWAFRA
ncbi:hypothetical protein ACNKHT_18040 [Shigella flexneri]